VDEVKPMAACQRSNIGSRVNREVHARFWERPGVRFLRATRHSRRFGFVRSPGHCGHEFLRQGRDGPEAAASLPPCQSFLMLGVTAWLGYVFGRKPASPAACLTGEARQAHNVRCSVMRRCPRSG